MPTWDHAGEGTKVGPPVASFRSAAPGTSPLAPPRRVARAAGLHGARTSTSPRATRHVPDCLTPASGSSTLAHADSCTSPSRSASTRARRRCSRRTAPDARARAPHGQHERGVRVLFQVLADAGDGVLVPAPSYPLFRFLARAAGVTSSLPFQYAGIWRVDLDAVRRLVRRARCSPCPEQPTGSFLAAPRRRSATRPPARRRRGLRKFSATAPPSGPLDGARLRASPGGARRVALRPLEARPPPASEAPAGSPPRAPALVRELFAQLEVLGDTFPRWARPSSTRSRSCSPRGPPRPPCARGRHEPRHAPAHLGPLEAPRRCCAEGGWYAVVRVPATRDDDPGRSPC